MKRIVILLALVLVSTARSLAARESRNCPDISAVSEALQAVGGVHSNIGKIEELASHKTKDSYLHIFSGKIDEEACVLFFNNKEQYLGHYNIGHGGVRSYSSRYKAIFAVTLLDGNVQIRLGNRGPWKEILAKNPFWYKKPEVEGKTVKLTPTQHYIAPTIQTEVRTWTYGEEEVPISAKLVDVYDNIVFLQNENSEVVYYILDDRLTNDDRKYLKTIKFEN